MGYSQTIIEYRKYKESNVRAKKKRERKGDKSDCMHVCMYVYVRAKKTAPPNHTLENRWNEE